MVIAAFLLPVVAYAGYFYSVSGSIGLTRTDARDMYGRAATIANCKNLDLPTYEKPLCPTRPVGERKGVDVYAHDRSLATRLVLPKNKQLNQVLRDFAHRVFVNQPLDLAHAVLVDFAKGFSWDRTTAKGDVPVSRWQFQTTYPTFGFDARAAGKRYGGGGPTVNRQLAQFLRAYQLNVGFVPGPFLGLAFLAGLVGAAGVGRARRSGLRAACFLPTACGLLLLLAADVFEFSWRYQLPALVLAPLGGALGVTALTRRHDTALETRAAPSTPPPLCAASTAPPS
jgi:hypothetical protein